MHGRPLFDKDGELTGQRETSCETTCEVVIEIAERQTERLQSLGKLTAGVAHNSNHMPAVIQGKCRADRA